MSAAGHRRDDVDYRVGADREVEATEAAYVLTVDEDVDVPTQRTRLVPDPGAKLGPGVDGSIQNRPQRGGLPLDRDDELAETLGQLTQDPGQDDPHAFTHASTAARTHKTSGS